MVMPEAVPATKGLRTPVASQLRTQPRTRFFTSATLPKTLGSCRVQQGLLLCLVAVLEEGEAFG
jgi:hypothetical protein